MTDTRISLEKYQTLESIFDDKYADTNSLEEAYYEILKYKPYDIIVNIDSPQDYKLHNTMFKNISFLAYITNKMIPKITFETALAIN